MADERPLHEVLLDYAIYAPIGLVCTVADELPRLSEKGRARLSPQLSIANMVGRMAVRQVQQRMSGRSAAGRRSAPSSPPGAAEPFPWPDEGHGGLRETPGPSAPSAATEEPLVDPEAPSPPPQSGEHEPVPGKRQPVPGKPESVPPSRSGAPAKRRPAARTAAPAKRRPAARTAAPAKRRPAARTAAASSTAPTGTTPSPSEVTEATRRTSSETEAMPPLVESLAIPGYDALAASHVVQRLSALDPGELEQVRRYESQTRGRRTVLHRIAQLSSTDRRASV